MAVSLLLALAAVPLALITVIIAQQRTQLAAYIRSLLNPASGQSSNDAAFMDATEGDEHETIELFIIEKIQPACLAQVALQEAILEEIGGNPKIMEYAKRGLVSHYWNSDFAKSYEVVVDFAGSPMPCLSNGDMIRFINTLEREGYREFCEQAEQLGKVAGFDYRTHRNTGPLWEEWRESHNALVSAYDELKRKSRLKGLYRPQRPSRWGEIEPPLVTDR